MKKKIKNVFLWIIGVFFMLLFLMYIKDAPISSICILICGIWRLPPIDDMIKRKLFKEEEEEQQEKYKNKIKDYNIIKNISIAVIFLIFMVNISTYDTQQTSTREDSLNTIQETSPISQNIVDESVTQSITETNGTYEGERVNGKKQGKGKFVWKDGSVYNGNFDNDQINGQGTLTIPNQGTYEGTFQEGKKNGQGTYKFENKDTYIGNWENDKMSGEGTYSKWRYICRGF